ncbi:MAG: C25 family cysteine peptidase, partial [Candidatus Glassbacteria bacterium]
MPQSKHRAAVAAILSALLALAGPARQSPASNYGFTVVSASRSRIEVRFDLPGWRLDLLDLGGESYARIEADRAEELLVHGYPVLPCYKAVVTVPPGCAVSSSWSAGTARRVNSGRIVPALAAVGMPDDAGYDTPDPVAYASAFDPRSDWPPQAVVVSGPVPLRDLMVVEILLYPFISRTAGGTLLVTDNFTITLDLAAGAAVPAGSFQAAPEPEFELVYREAVLNYQQAAGWKIPRNRPVPALASSPFEGGEAWVRVEIDSSGMYALTGSQLTSAGIATAGIDPATLRLYSGGNRMLDEDPSASRPALRQIALQLTGASAGRFDDADSLLFYAQSVDRFTAGAAGGISSIRHRYANRAVYWLTWGGEVQAGLRMETPESPPGLSTPYETAEVWYHFEGNTEYAALDDISGDRIDPAPDYWAWVVEGDETGTARRRFDFAEDVSAAGNYLRYEIYGRGLNYPGAFSVSVNGGLIASGTNREIAAFTSGWLALPAGLVTAAGNELTLGAAGQLLGFFEIRADTRLAVGQAGQFAFHETRNFINPGYSLRAPSPAVRVYDVTVPDRPAVIAVRDNGNSTLGFSAPVATQVRSFVAVAQGGYRRPSGVAPARPELQTAAGAEYVVIAPRELFQQAQRLASMRSSRYSILTVAAEDIYDRYSFGPVDPAALRDFLKEAFDSWPVRPRFAVLFGDGHLDYRGNTVQGRSRANYLPPWVSDRDVAVEEWFGRFGGGDLPQLSIGRIPAQSASEAQAVLDKIAAYEAGTDAGEWSRRILLVADDGYVLGRDCDPVTNHVPGSELLDSLFPAEFERRKVYLDAYPFDPPGIGTRKPAANTDLLSWWNRGALVINYLGHGDNLNWSQERVFQSERDVPLLANGYRLPLVLNSSCSIGQFDDYQTQAMAERLVAHPGGGAIAVFAGTRVTFAFQNLALNSLFVRKLFEQPGRPIGLSQLEARIGLAGSDLGNAERYAIFGDPALILHT